MQSHPAESEYGRDVAVVLLDLLPEPDRLVVLRRVDVLRPAALGVVHPLAEVLRALGVHLEVNSALKNKIESRRIVSIKEQSLDISISLSLPSIYFPLFARYYSRI